jgi:hypothetical protein
MTYRLISCWHGSCLLKFRTRHRSVSGVFECGRIQKENKMSKIKQPDLKVLRDFYGYPAQKLAPFGVNVSVNLDVKLFPNLPVPPDQLKLLADTLTAKIADRVTGGPAATAAQAKAFAALADALNADANIVELTVGSDLEMLLNTGYLPASTNRTSSPLDDTSIAGLYNNGSTQLLLRLARVRNAASYQVQVSTDGGVTWQEAVVSRKANRIVLPNLTPTKTYLVRARAIGGSTGSSAWVVSGSIVCT